MRIVRTLAEEADDYSDDDVQFLNDMVTAWRESSEVTDEDYIRAERLAMSIEEFKK